MNIRLFAFILLLVTFSFSNTSFAQGIYEYEAKEKIFDASKYSSQIKQVEDYLSSFTTLKSRFSQIAPGQALISQGEIYISRPGKARWEYVRPYPILMIIDDDKFSYYDKKLDQVTYAKVPPTPFEILLRKNVKLSGDIEVVDVFDQPSTLTMVIKSKRFYEGSKDDDDLTKEYLSLVFDKNPLKLKRLHRTNYNNVTTTIRLIDPALDAALDEELFVFRNPKFFRKRRRK